MCVRTLSGKVATSRFPSNGFACYDELACVELGRWMSCTLRDLGLLVEGNILLSVNEGTDICSDWDVFRASFHHCKHDTKRERVRDTEEPSNECMLAFFVSLFTECAKLTGMAS